MTATANAILAASATSGSGVIDSLKSDINAGAANIAAVPGDIALLPFLDDLSQVMPAADLIVGSVLLCLIVLVHATGVRTMTSHIARRTQRALATPSMWRADVLMVSTVFILLILHISEIFLWSGALVYGGLIPSWHSAGLFAGNTYTTLGYGDSLLPAGWGMLAPVIAISGMFTFGWSASVLVDLVGRCQRIKDAAIRAKAQGHGTAPPGAQAQGS